ncbi:MAG: hypothetical protein AAGD25_21155 [Cyanobacteria bacterium P01_F01_bin.150]
MNFWLSVIEGCGIFIAIWLSSWLINENNTSSLAWLFQPIFFIGLLLAWVVPIDWSIHNWITLLVAFSLNLISNIANHKRLAMGIQGLIDKQSWWQIGPLRRYKVMEGYVRDSGMQDNAYTSRFGVLVLGISSNVSLRHWLFGKDGWEDDQRTAILRHERGHDIFAVPIISLQTLVFYWFYNSFALWNGLFLIPTFLSAWTLVSWLDELLADTVAGHYGLSLFESIFRDASLPDYILGGIGAYSHPPLMLRKLAFCYVIPIGVGLFAVSLIAIPSIVGSM